MRLGLSADSAGGNVSARTPGPWTVADSTRICQYTILLASGEFATLGLPDNLSLADVAKLAAIMRTLTVDFVPPVTTR